MLRASASVCGTPAMAYELAESSDWVVLQPEMVIADSAAMITGTIRRRGMALLERKVMI